MRTKNIYHIGIVILLLICITAYFKPLPFSDTVKENNQISMVLSNLGVRNGEAYIDSVEYKDITAEQNSAILSLLGKFNYKRNFGTLFSNGSISDIGDEMLSIYVYDDDTLVNSILVTSLGKVVVNNKSYSMKNAEQLIQQIVKIMKKAE